MLGELVRKDLLGEAELQAHRPGKTLKPKRLMMIRRSNWREINSEFAQVDVGYGIGANDVTNPMAATTSLHRLRYADPQIRQGLHPPVRQELARLRAINP